MHPLAPLHEHAGHDSVHWRALDQARKRASRGGGHGHLGARASLGFVHPLTLEGGGQHGHSAVVTRRRQRSLRSQSQREELLLTLRRSFRRDGAGVGRIQGCAFAATLPCAIARAARP